MIVIPESVQRPPRFEPRPQAASLPVNRGVFGSVEGVHRVTNKDETAETSAQHHPADRDYQSPTTQPMIEARPSFTVANPLVGHLEPEKIRSVGGVRLTTLLLCAIQLFALGGTIAIWVFTTITVKAILVSKHENTAGSLTVFIHVAFVIIFLGQLVFLQRGIHRLRRERYQHLRPGEIPPPQQHSRSSCDTLAAIAPWNQPQPRLPLYLSALSQTGVATGDIEDNRKAISPPPAYRAMRESTLPHSAR